MIIEPFHELLFHAGSIQFMSRQYINLLHIVQFTCVDGNTACSAVLPLTARNIAKHK